MHKKRSEVTHRQAKQEKPEWEQPAISGQIKMAITQ
jgi:hypothetical protein